MMLFMLISNFGDKLYCGSDGGIYVSNIIENGINQDTVFNVKNGQLSILRSGEAYYGISSTPKDSMIGNSALSLSTA